MGLDIYVGPLCRYYSGDWKTVTQQFAEETGAEYRVIRAKGSSQGETADAAQIREAILAWRQSIASDFGGRIEGPLDWIEAFDGAYYTDKPDFDGFAATHVAALTIEFPDVSPPRSLDAYADERLNPYKQLVEHRYSGTPDAGPQPMFPNLLLAEMWLPTDLTKLIYTNEPAGNPILIGSVPSLLAELESINERLFHLDATLEEKARLQGLPPGDARPMEIARAGLAILLRVARFGVEHQLPIKLDY